MLDGGADKGTERGGAVGRLKRWPMPRNAQFSHYCCHCVYWEFERDIGCAHLGVCRAVEGEPEERDAYDKPCELWKEASK